VNRWLFTAGSVKTYIFPLTLNTDMLPGFKEGQEKMSKSDPTSAIFMEDDEVYSQQQSFVLLVLTLRCRNQLYHVNA
jgi:hypothetical protein